MDVEQDEIWIDGIWHIIGIDQSMNENYEYILTIKLGLNHEISGYDFFSKSTGHINGHSVTFQQKINETTYFNDCIGQYDIDSNGDIVMMSGTWVQREYEGGDLTAWGTFRGTKFNSQEG